MRICALILALLFNATAALANDALQAMQGIADIKHHVVVSEHLEREFQILVHLPPNGTNQENLPVVYLLDGGMLFPMLAGYSNYLRLQGAIPDLVVVGISYGTSDYREGNMRSTDYTAPSETRDYWGGAEQFRHVLATEIIPLIESNYKTDPARRIVFGQSIGGQFAIYSTFTEPELFYGHIASNPAIHENLDFYLQNPKGKKHTRLFVGHGDGDETRFREPRSKWLAHWEAVESKPFELRSIEFEGHGHFSVPPESFRQGLEWLLSVTDER